jgi:uncharacterized phage protein (TIGR02218 family)
VRTIPAGFNDSEVTSLQVCWRLIRRDGIEIRGTEYDVDIPSTTGAYVGDYLAHTGITGSDIRSTSDLSVDNLEITGALVPSTMTGDTGDSSSALTLLDVSAADIEAGLLDNAECVTFLVNADDPDLHQHVLRSGWIGNVRRTAEGQYTTELRGLAQALSQGIVRTYGIACDAELGDERCKADTTAVTMTNTVAVVTNRRVFQVVSAILGTIPAHLVPGSLVTWTSGLNTGYRMEVDSYAALVLTLYLPMPADIQVGDTFIHRGACDKQISTCINTYNNLLNFRGHGVFVPGDTEVLKVGKR